MLSAGDVSVANQNIRKQEDEIAYIHNETRRLERLIAQLHEERSALLRRLNMIQSPTINIPAETLSLIFQHACPAPDFSSHHDFFRSGEEDGDDEEDKSLRLSEARPFQLTLGSVSSHWRQVIHSSPRLWDSLSLDMQPHSMKKSAAILRLFLTNSRTVPFALSLRFPEIMGPNTPFLVHRSVDDTIIANLSRIRELYLVRPPRRWHSYTHLLTHLTECSLDLSRHETYNPDKAVILPSNAPLHRFSLQGALWRFDADFQLPWLSVTSLTLSSLPPDLSVQAFIQFPNLVEFRCVSYSYFVPPVKPVSIKGPVIFRHLEILEWETKATPWSSALIRHLHVPVLRKMRWSAFEDPRDDAFLFFQRLPPTLTELELFPPSHLDYIRDDMNIEHLCVNECSAQDLLAVFEKLKTNSGVQGVVIPLPRLKELTIKDGSDNLTRLDGSYSIAVWEMLDQRLGHSTESFFLDMPTVDFEWLPEVQTHLQEIYEEGYMIRIRDLDTY